VGAPGAAASHIYWWPEDPIDAKKLPSLMKLYSLLKKVMMDLYLARICSEMFTVKPSEGFKEFLFVRYQYDCYKTVNYNVSVVRGKNGYT